MTLINRILGFTTPLFIFGALSFFMHLQNAEVYLFAGGIACTILLIIRFLMLTKKDIIQFIKHFGLIFVLCGFMLSVNTSSKPGVMKYFILVMGSLGALGVVIAFYDAFFKPKDFRSTLVHPFLLVSIALGLLGNFFKLMEFQGANILFILAALGSGIWSMYVFGLKGGST